MAALQGLVRRAASAASARLRTPMEAITLRCNASVAQDRSDDSGVGGGVENITSVPNPFLSEAEEVQGPYLLPVRLRPPEDVGKRRAERLRKAGRVTGALQCLPPAPGETQTRTVHLDFELSKWQRLAASFDRDGVRAVPIHLVFENWRLPSSGQQDDAPPFAPRAVVDEINVRSYQRAYIENVNFRFAPRDGTRVRVQVPLYVTGHDACPAIASEGFDAAVQVLWRVVCWCHGDKIPKNVTVSLQGRNIGQPIRLADVQAQLPEGVEMCKKTYRDMSQPAVLVPMPRRLSAYEMENEELAAAASKELR
ncbi:unnamed protein product [Pedinophyceae sp. YPF-701]|nr:unnamed protein product [Pedinophyceae sp. YPF-701]